jgi:hypothetical protein
MPPLHQVRRDSVYVFSATRRSTPDRCGHGRKCIPKRGFSFGAALALASHSVGSLRASCPSSLARHPTTPPPHLSPLAPGVPALAFAFARGPLDSPMQGRTDEARGRFTSQHAHVVWRGVHAARKVRWGVWKKFDPSRCLTWTTWFLTTVITVVEHKSAALVEPGFAHQRDKSPSPVVIRTG